MSYERIRLASQEEAAPGSERPMETLITGAKMKQHFHQVSEQSLYAAMQSAGLDPQTRDTVMRNYRDNLAKALNEG